MSNFTPQKVFDNYAIQCKETWQANAILKYAHSCGYKWSSGETFLSNTRWDRYKSDTAYKIGKGTYNAVKGYEGSGVEVILFSDAATMLGIPFFEEGYRIPLEEEKVTTPSYNFISSDDFTLFVEAITKFKEKHPNYTETNLIQYRGLHHFFIAFKRDDDYITPVQEDNYYDVKN